MHHSRDSITDTLGANEAWQRANFQGDQIPGRPIEGRVTIDLEVGDSAWNPASTKTEIHGPTRVVYVRHQDGGIDVLAFPLGQFRSNHWSPPAMDVNL